jgi:BlaI family transcriptional regulator, penicillinase repressor
MASTPRLGKVQLQIMRLLWERKQATAREITDELARTQSIAHSTVQTLLRKMELKGAVTHDIVDRTFVFHPLYRQEDVTDTALRDLLSRLFDGSVYGMVSHLLKSEDVSSEELARLRRLIDEEEQRQ